MFGKKEQPRPVLPYKVARARLRAALDEFYSAYGADADPQDMRFQLGFPGCPAPGHAVNLAEEDFKRAYVQEMTNRATRRAMDRINSQVLATLEEDE